MKIAVCDDEVYFQNQIKEELEKFYQSLDILTVPFLSGEELLKAVQKEPSEYACIFMDIEMKGMDGLETSRHIRKINPDIPIILLTSHKEFAMDGYEIDAFRFLTKPVNREKLHQALSAMEKLKVRNGKIVVGENGLEIYLAFQDIHYIKSENVNLQLVTAKQTYWTRKKLSEQMRELPDILFYQVHKSYIVNMMYIQTFDGRSIIMNNDIHIPVSRNRRNNFKNAMLRYLKETR